MKKVEFVRISSALCGYGFGKGTRYCFSEVEETIQAYIENGWEYSGYVPIETRGTGDIEVMSLVFTRED